MIEIKEEVWLDPDKQNAILKDILAYLTPGQDYHLMSLKLIMLEGISFVPSTALIPISELSINRYSHEAINKNYAGIASHFIFLTKNRINKHLEHNQKTGVGFSSSKNGLYREINRGVDWIFTDTEKTIMDILEM